MKPAEIAGELGAHVGGPPRHIAEVDRAAGNAAPRFLGDFAGGALGAIAAPGDLAERLGGAASQRVASITWERTLEQLLLV